MNTEQARATLPSVMVVCNHEEQCALLRNVVGAGGANVVATQCLEEFDPDAVDLTEIDCILINLEPDIDQQAAKLDRVLDLDLPVVFNDAEATRRLVGWDQARWARHLIAKIRGVTDVLPPLPEHEQSGTPVAPQQAQSVRELWVLGASIGGPEAVRTFLSELPADLPVAFILAQHMGAEFLNLMATQLNRASELLVKCAEEGHPLQYGQVVIAPVGKRLLIDENCRIHLAAIAEESPYSPSIDQVLVDMSDRFGQRVNTIIFSGMARDGIEGAVYVAKNGGKVWAQSEDSCVISSMVEGAAQAGVISVKGTPKELAKRMIEAHA